jgi:hypothetical protein
MFSRSWIRGGGIALCILLVAVIGCGPNLAKAKVKGRVRFMKDYLKAGTVGFINKEGQIGVAQIDYDGNYEMNDAPIGPCKIPVKVPIHAVGKGGTVTTGPKAPPGLPEMRPPGGPASEKTVAPTIDPKDIVKIPSKYADPEKSDLTYTVEKGEQTHNITLSP